MEQFLYVLSALATAVWSVWTWSEGQQNERQLKRDQEAALYANPILLALAELQSRLYKILEEDELAFYKREYPDQYEFGSPAAVEVLYHFGQCFGWEHHALRYGPNTKDPTVIELIRKIGETLESRNKFSGEAFRFGYDERVSLGEAVVRRVGEVTAVLPVFESIPLYQFEQEISDAQSKHAPLYQSKAVRCTLAAIDRADRAESIEGRERLAALQNLFVELLTYLEEKEGIRVSIGEYKKVRLKKNPDFACSIKPAVAKILHQTPGRVRVRIPRLKTDRAYANHLQSLLESMENVSSFRINVDAASVVIHHSPNVAGEDFARSAANTIEKGGYVSPA